MTFKIQSAMYESAGQSLDKNETNQKQIEKTTKCNKQHICKKKKKKEL